MDVLVRWWGGPTWFHDGSRWWHEPSGPPEHSKTHSQVVNCPFVPGDRRRSSTSMTLNPYTPPNTVSENALNDGDRIRSLSRAATLYRRIGWIGIIYFFVAFPLGLWSGSEDGPLPIGSVVGIADLQKSSHWPSITDTSGITTLLIGCSSRRAPGPRGNPEGPEPGGGVGVDT